MNLFCIPYAGGTEDIFTNWKLDSRIKVEPILLKGRKNRMFGGNYKTLEEAADDCCEQILLQLNHESEYCLFGHSMGAVIAYEVYYQLRKMEAPLPKTIFFSSCNMPGIKFTGRKLSHLEDEELVSVLKSLGGIDERLLQHREILYFYLNVFRGDLKILEEYEPHKYREPIQSNISILYSMEDYLIDGNSVEQWKKMTNGNCSFHEFSGGHFFIEGNELELMDVLNTEIMGN